MPDSFDLIVIGAGPAGAAAACHAAGAGLRVALLDRERFPRDKVCGDGLTARAVVELRRMQLEDAVAREGARISRFELRAPLARTEATLEAAPGFPDYAWVLPRLRLDALLVERAAAAGARLLEAHEVRGWRSDAQGIEVHAEVSAVIRKLRAPLAILATGAHLGALMRMKLLTHKPAMMIAIRQYFDAMRGPEDLWRLHYQRQTRPGYGWIFPGGKGLANAGVGLYAREGISLEQGLRDYLATSAVREVLGSARALDRPRSFPLRSDFLSSPLHAERLLIAGEAAGLVNPLTGEGIDYALESGRIAAEHALLRLSSADRDIGTAYETALHAQFRASFLFSTRLRDWCRAPWRVSLLTLAAERRPDLKARLVRMLLGGGEIQSTPSFVRIVAAVLGMRRGGNAPAPRS